MKNTAERNIFRKKGFFVALYSCLGIVAILAMVMTFTNRTQDQDTNFASEMEETATVGASQVESYLAGFDEEAWFRPRQNQPEQTPAPAPAPSAPPAPSQGQDAPPRTLPGSAPQVAPPPEVDANDGGEEAEAAPSAPPEAVPAQTPAPSPSSEYQPAPAPAPRAASFTPFAEGDVMSWPVYGETVMPFSGTSLIFDPTLDQFRTNDNLRIAAEEGAPVRAGAYGQVVAVGQNVRQGNYIVIDHGNGWIATYGQLMENILVNTGDIVSNGQIIGGVGQPSLFGSANGTHLHLRIEHAEEAINPYYVLAARTDC